MKIYLQQTIVLSIIKHSLCSKYFDDNLLFLYPKIYKTKIKTLKEKIIIHELLLLKMVTHCAVLKLIVSLALVPLKFLL